MSVSEKLRLVQGLHSHAEMFGFKWDDDSDWTWHDVACKIADEVDAENAKLRECVEELEELLPENGRWFSAEVVEAYVAEIKKLRELVRDYDMYIVTCDTRTIEGSIKASHDLFELEVRMRELGVEVD